MFYINVQQVDYDDYPLGQPTKIGPFESKSDAEDFMENSTQFFKQNLWGYECWRMAQRGNHTVYVKSLTYGLEDPGRYA